MRPPVTMPLEETMMQGERISLIFRESSCLGAKWNPSQFNGEPYFRTSCVTSSLNSPSYFMKISTALIAMGLSTKTGSRGIWLASMSSLSRNKKQKQEFLRALHSKGRNDDGAA